MRPLSNFNSSVCFAVRHFAANWFLVPQGTGIVAVILWQLHYQFPGLEIISIIVWILTIVLLISFLLVYISRWILFPHQVAKSLVTGGTECNFLASICISFTTIIQMILLVLVQRWSNTWGIVGYILWWINTAMSVTALIGIPYLIVKKEPPGLSAFSPAAQLPLIAALTSAAGGGVLCRYGHIDKELQTPVIVVSYLLIGAGLPLALGTDAIFLTRLLNKSSPKELQIFQEMILCGPWGQGSFALQILGDVVLRGGLKTDSRSIFFTKAATDPVGYGSIMVGLVFWGQGTFWWAFAVISIIHSVLCRPKSLRNFKFSLTAWSLVFPWGVYTNAAVELGKLLNSPAFNIWSTALTIILIIILLLNTTFTLYGAFTGTIFGLERNWKVPNEQNSQV